MTESFFDEPQASELEALREKARLRSIRITFDCYNAIYPSEGDRVKCKLGHKMAISLDGTMGIATVMTGRTGSGCRRCKDFNGD